MEYSHEDKLASCIVTTPCYGTMLALAAKSTTARWVEVMLYKELNETKINLESKVKEP